MANSGSRETMDAMWRLTSDVGTTRPVPYPGLEASPLGAAVTQPTGRVSAGASSHSAQPLPSPSSSQGTTPQWDPTGVFPVPPPSLYDPRCRPASSHIQPTLLPPTAGPPLPFIPPAIVQAAPEPVMTALDALQTQFTAFQEHLADVKSDVKDALSQLQTLRTAQTKTNKCMAGLEAVVGVSPIGTVSRGCGQRGRRGRPATRAESPHNVDDADAGIVLEKTLVQSLASIRSAIEELVARPSQSRIHLGAISTSSSISPTGHDPFRISSPPRSIVDPPHSTLQSQSLLHPLVPPLGSRMSLPPAGPGTKYTDVSIQASPTEPPCSLFHSQRHAPGFTPVDWNVDAAIVERCTNNPAWPSAYTAEYMTHFHRDNQKRNGTSIATDIQMLPGDRDYPPANSSGSYTESLPHTPPATSSSSYSSEPVAIPSSSPGTSAVAVSGKATTEIRSSPARIVQTPLLQAPSPVAEGTNSLMASDEPQTSVTSSLNSLTRNGDTPASTSGSQEHVGRLAPSHMELDPKDAEMVSGVDEDKVPAVGDVRLVAEFITAVLVNRRHSPPVEADEGLPSGLPTPPSEALSEEREPQVANDSTYKDNVTTGSERILYRSQGFPVIPTPPFLTPEPSGGDDRVVATVAGQSAVGAFSESLSPLTPALLSPAAAAGSSLPVEGRNNGGGQVATQQVTEQSLNSTNSARSAIVSEGNATQTVTADVSMNEHADGRSSPQTSRVSVEESVSPADSSVEIKTITHPSGPTAVSNKDSSRVGDGSRFITPRSPVEQPDMEPPETRPDDNVTGAAHTSIQTYFLHSSSPLSATHPISPRYLSPSDSSSSRLTQDEDEVFNVLMLDASGGSTPADSGSLSWVWSQPTSSSMQPLPLPESAAASTSTYVHDARAKETSSISTPRVLAVDASILMGAPHIPRGPASSSVGTLTPLTPLDDSTDVGNDDNHVTVAPPRCIKKPRLGALGDASPQQRSGSVARALSGGPRASLDEFACLARREPLRIRLKLPDQVGKLKRKRDAVDSEGEEGEREKEGWNNERGDDSVRSPVNAVSQERYRELVAGKVSTRAVTSAASVSRPAPKNATSSGIVGGTDEQPHISSDPSPGKKIKKPSKFIKKPTDPAQSTSVHTGTGIPPKKRGPKRKPPVKYHVRNGQIVTAEPPPPKVAARSDEVRPGSQAPPRVRLRDGPVEQAIKMPARKSSGASSRRAAQLSPVTEATWDEISERGGTWPKLPSVLNHWDAQFIQCDKCDKWYHYGCVGIVSGDPRLDSGVMFVCPPCQTQSARRLAPRHGGDTCARPDCPEPQVTEEMELFFVQKLVGRKKVEGRMYIWLAQWEGYPMSQATWIPKENVVGDGTKLFDAFLEDAVKEGADLSQDVVLLREALDAGWAA